MLKLLKKGAEADIYKTVWGGSNAILKIRKPRTYRNRDLDARIRRQRTTRESQAISQARSFGIPVPLVYLVDTKESLIVMQEVLGRPVQSLPGDVIVGLSRQMGRFVGMLHKNGVMHGDLTTSNFICDDAGGMLYMIDFGLSQNTTRQEDYAVDMRLIKEILNSAHANIMERAWKNLLDGYSSVVGSVMSTVVIQLVSDIERRGRYATVV